MVLATDSAPVPNGAIVYTDLSSLNTLRAAQKENPNGALLAAAQQFESLFVQMMLASMRSASLGDGIFDSQGENFYRELYDKQLAVSLAGDGGRGSTLGLTSMLMRQLGGMVPPPEVLSPPRESGTPVRLPVAPSSIAPQPGDQSSDAITPQHTKAVAAYARIADLPTVDRPAADRPEADRPAGDLPVMVAAHAASDTQRTSRALETPDLSSPQAFVRTLMPHAQAAARALGVPPQALLAQAALETGWGAHVPLRTDGSSSHNLFGIKAGASWSGDRIDKMTHEFVNGRMRKETATFRAYDSFEQSFLDYVDLLRGASRYQDALRQVEEPRAFFEALQRAGYATDPDYADKLLRVMSGPSMQAAVGAATIKQG